jgi:hypothetical protein
VYPLYLKISINIQSGNTKAFVISATFHHVQQHQKSVAGIFFFAWNTSLISAVHHTGAG